MKKLALICLTLCSLDASAYIMSQSELLNICEQQTFSSEKQDCARLAQQGLFDSDAVNFCQKQLTFSSEKSNCMKSIINKRYDTAMLRFCSGLTFSSEKTSCLKEAKFTVLNPRPEPGTCSSHQTKRSLTQILRALQYGLYDEAEFLTQDLLFKLSN